MKRPLLIAALAALAMSSVGAILATDGHALRSNIPGDQLAQRALLPAIPGERRMTKSVARTNMRSSRQLQKLDSDVRLLRKQRQAAATSAWQEGYDPARQRAYPAAYNAAFPLKLGTGDWYIVRALRRGGYHTTTWDAPEGQEYVIAGGVKEYSPGTAPNPYSLSAGGAGGGSYPGPGDVPGYYNSDGNWVPSPSSDPTLTPSGPTATCADGTYSYSQHASGTCSYHGGVSTWGP
jgi:hypothetical protein